MILSQAIMTRILTMLKSNEEIMILCERGKNVDPSKKSAKAVLRLGTKIISKPISPKKAKAIG